MHTYINTYTQKEVEHGLRMAIHLGIIGDVLIETRCSETVTQKMAPLYSICTCMQRLEVIMVNLDFEF